MKTPEEIKKGLECCASAEIMCGECPYYEDGVDCEGIEEDALAHIQQLEAREWDLFDLLSSAWFGKRCYFRQDDGNVYSRVSGEYMSLDQAIDELAHELTSDRECEQAGKDINVPRWISVEERLPENDSKYLVYTPDTCVPEIAEYCGDGEWLTPDLENLTRFVTHWMPLPPAPKEG